MAYYNPAAAAQGGQGGQQQMQYQAPIVYYTAPAVTYQNGFVKHFGLYYERQTSTSIGAIQIVLGCVSIAAGIMAIVYNANAYWIGIGIWSGVIYLVAGSIAITAGKQPSNELIIATLVFSTFDILFGVAQATVAALAVQHDVYFSYRITWAEAAIAANSLMIGVGCLEIVFGFWLLAVSARAIDQGSKEQPVTFPVTCSPNQPGTVFIQAPSSSFQPQPPPYYIQSQYPSTSNQQQQMMYSGVHQPPITTIKL